MHALLQFHSSLPCQNAWHLLGMEGYLYSQGALGLLWRDRGTRPAL